MARKLKLIFISTLMLILILSVNSFASLDFTTEEAQNIIDYMISEETEANILNIYENVDINAFKNFLNNSSFTNVTSKNQLILFYSDTNNLLRIATTNATIGTELGNVNIYYYNTNDSYRMNFVNGGKSLRISSSTGFSYPYNHTNGYTVSIGTNVAEINYNNSTVTIEKLRACSNVTPINFRIKDATDYEWLFLRPSITPEIIYPPVESGDNSGDSPSGDSGGGTIYPDYSEDLDNIQTGITDINNNIGQTNNKLDYISGELSNINNNLTTVPDISDTTITNDDITSNLDFEFEQDPYTNFWLELTTGLGNAFTNSKREINIQFRDNTYIVSLDDFSVQVPSVLKPFLTIISTVFITWKMLQYVKIIIDNISSGNIDEVLEMNEEEGIINLF